MESIKDKLDNKVNKVQNKLKSKSNLPAEVVPVVSGSRNIMTGKIN